LKTAIVSVAFLAILSWGAIHFGALAASVTASWSYDYGPLPACSNAQAVSCIDHFEVKDLTNQQKPKTILTVNNPTGAAGKIDGIKTSFRYGPPFGEVTFSVVAVERDKNGTFVSSNPYAARATATIRPGVHASVVF
jgi:hypothetical protein